MEKKIYDIETVTKMAGVSGSINIAEEAAKVLDHVVEKKIAIDNNNQKHLIEILELSPEILYRTYDGIRKVYSQACIDSDSVSVKNLENLINLFQPSVKLREESFSKKIESDIRNSEARTDAIGWMGIIAITLTGIAVAVVAHNKTTSIPLWHKR